MGGIGFGILRYSRLSKPFQLLIQMLIIIFVSELAGRFLWRSMGSTYPFYHVLQVLQILYYGLIFSLLITSGKAWKSWIFIVAASGAVVSIAVSIFHQPLNTFPSLGSQLLSIYVVVLSLILIMKLLRSPKEGSLLLLPEFWFATGSLFFYSITFFTFAYFNLGVGNPEWGYTIIRLSNYILYGCCFLTLFFDAQLAKQRHES